MANITRLSDGHFQCEVSEGDDFTHNILTRALAEIAFVLNLEEEVVNDAGNLHTLQVTRLSDKSFFVEVVLRPNVE